MAKTDWDAYYRQPASFAPLTRKITERKLIGLLSRFDPRTSAKGFCELGGGDSCIFDAIRSRYPGSLYTVVDNNALGLELFRQRHGGDAAIQVVERDVLSNALVDLQADVVLSLGLIEHFSPDETAQAVRAHFAAAREGGLVMITFPTPTWLYRATRTVAEAVGVWAFPDERPLRVADVEAEVLRYGDLLHSSITWGVVLTQGVLVCRARVGGAAAAAAARGRC